MATAAPAFSGTTLAAIFAAILKEDPPPPSHLNAEIPPKLEAIILKALEKRREVRYQHASDLGADLKRVKRDTDSGRSAATAPALGSLQQATEGSIIAPRRGAKTRWPVFALCASVAVFLITAGWIFLNRHRDRRLLPPRVMPFTGLPGREDQAAFSPDGNQLTFTSTGGSGDVTHTYVKLIGAGTPLRLTNSTKSDFSPVWSPDGRYIAFAREADQGSEVLSVPSLGGQERWLGHSDVPPAEWNNSFGFAARILAWSPDGKLIAVVDKGRICFVSVANLEQREFTSSPAGYFMDINPAFSPDGRTLAFSRWGRGDLGNIYLQPVAGGQPRRLTSEGNIISGFAWTTDARAIVYSANRAGLFILWRCRFLAVNPSRWRALGRTLTGPRFRHAGNCSPTPNGSRMLTSGGRRGRAPQPKAVRPLS